MYNNNNIINNSPRQNLPEKNLNPVQETKNILLKDPNIQQFLDINKKYHQQTQNFAKQKQSLMNIDKNINTNKFSKSNKENTLTKDNTESDPSTALNTGSGSKPEENLQDSIDIQKINNKMENIQQSPIQTIIQTMKQQQKKVPMSQLNNASQNNNNLYNIKTPGSMKQQTPVLMQRKQLSSSQSIINMDTEHNFTSSNNVNNIIRTKQNSIQLPNNNNQQLQHQQSFDINNFTCNSINTQEDEGKNGIIQQVFNKKSSNKKPNVLFSPNTQTIDNINYAIDASNKAISDLKHIESTNENSIKSIYSLDLSVNKFMEIPNDIVQFQSLKILKLDNNFIKILPNTFFTQLRLETFSIMNNLLKSIPDKIINWKMSLQSLNIAKNHISEFQPAICEMKCLKVLIVSSNDFESIPKKFINLKSCLKELAIDWFKYTQPQLDEVARGETLNKLFKITQQIPVGIKSLTTQYFLMKMSLDSYDPYQEVIQNQKSKRNQLHQSVASEDLSMLRYLLSSNPQLAEQLDHEGHTPLSLAIRQEKYFCAKIIIFSNINVNLGGGPLGSCLNLGVIKQQQYLVRDLLKMKADTNQQDKEGNTPLHYLFAVFNKDKAESKIIADLLLQHNADPDIENQEGHSPIHIAARKGSHAAIMYILNYNKDPKNQNKKLFKIDKVCGEQRHSILHVAAHNGHTELVSTLLRECPETFSKTMAVNLQINMSSKNNTIQKLMKIAEKKFINHHILKIPLQQGEIPSTQSDLNLNKPHVNPVINLSQDLENLDYNLRKRPLTPIKPRTLQKQQQPSNNQEIDDISFDYISSSSQNSSSFSNIPSDSDDNLRINQNFQLQKKLNFDHIGTIQETDREQNQSSLQKQKFHKKNIKLSDQIDLHFESDDMLDTDENHDDSSNGIITETFNFDPNQSHKILPNETQFKIKHSSSQYKPQIKVKKPSQSNQIPSNNCFSSDNFSKKSSSNNNLQSNDSFEDFDVEDFQEEAEWPLMHSKGMPYIIEKDMGCCSLLSLSNRKKAKTSIIIQENIDRKLKNLIQNCYQITDIRQKIMYKSILPKKLSCIYSLFSLHNSILECISHLTRTSLYTLQKQGINKILSPLELERDSRLVFLLNNVWIIIETMKEIYDLLTSKEKNKFQITCLYAQQQYFNINDEFDCQILQNIIATNYPQYIQNNSTIHELQEEDLESDNDDDNKSEDVYSLDINNSLESDFKNNNKQYNNNKNINNNTNILALFNQFQGIQVLNDGQKQYSHHKFLITESGFEKFFPLEEEKIPQIGDSIKIYQNEKKRINPLIPRQYI